MGEIGLNQFAPYLLNRFVADGTPTSPACCRGLGVTTTQFRALSVLAVASGITVNDLAVYRRHRTIHHEPHPRRPGGAGFVRRKPKSDDMRAREVFITEDGLALFAGLWPQVYGATRADRPRRHLRGRQPAAARSLARHDRDPAGVSLSGAAELRRRPCWIVGSRPGRATGPA